MSNSPYGHYMPDKDDYTMADRLFNQFRHKIERLNVDRQECYFGTIYHDRWGVDHEIFSGNPHKVVSDIYEKADPRDHNSVVIVVFMDSDGSRAFYLYKEALRLLNVETPYEYIK